MRRKLVFKSNTGMRLCSGREMSSVPEVYMEVPVSSLLYLFGFSHCAEVRSEKAQIRLENIQYSRRMSKMYRTFVKSVTSVESRQGCATGAGGAAILLLDKALSCQTVISNMSTSRRGVQCGDITRTPERDSTDS